MNDNKLNWNAHEFRVYLLLYASYADLSLNEAEKQMIVSKATKGEYIHILKVFEKDNDVKRLETILSFREIFFPTEKDVEKLLTEILAQLNIDEELNINEKNFYNILSKLLNLKC